ncbi:MAG: S9 family peptidase [Thermomicrobiales bacterium]|nr:S9 family peptidase [Thermomicrobiales bacterium]
MARTVIALDKTMAKKKKSAIISRPTPKWIDRAPRAALEKARKDGRDMTIEDLYVWELPGNPRVSPDGSKIVYEVLSIDKESDEYCSTLWLIEEDHKPRKLTSGGFRDVSPAWSPDGNKIAFTSNRGEKNQLFVLPIDGGEAVQITTLESGVGQFIWSPDGSKIAFTSRIAPKKRGESDVKVINSAYYKFDGMGFIEDAASQICLVKATGGDHEQLTEGAFNHTQIAFSPNGYEIAFVANLNVDWDVRRERDIWTIDIYSRQKRRLTDGKGAWHAPTYSPNSKLLAFIGEPDAYAENVNEGLYVIPSIGGAIRRLDRKLNRTIGDTGMSGPAGSPGDTLIWTSDSLAVDAIVSDCGDTHVVRFPINGKKSINLTPSDRHIKAFQHQGEDLVIASAQPARPMELSRITAKGETRLTHHNDAWVREVYIPQPEEFWFRSGEEIVQGWLIRPRDNTWKSDNPVPVVLNIHGGPHAQFSPAFFHELQMFVARGSALVFTNPRGSTGRTNAFGKAVQGRWGFADMPDFMAALDYAISMGGLDPNRLGVTGGSYGGFSTNWLLGHTDRFRAAVTDRSISNMASMYGTDDISLVGFDKDLGTPWENPTGFWEASPLAYVQNVTAPCLIIHSEEDYRCPMEQAEQWYMALKSLGRTVEFVRFPDESHGLGRNGKPKHRVERLRRTLEWFEKYL